MGAEKLALFACACMHVFTLHSICSQLWTLWLMRVGRLPRLISLGPRLIPPRSYPCALQHAATPRAPPCHPGRHRCRAAAVQHAQPGGAGELLGHARALHLPGHAAGGREGARQPRWAGVEGHVWVGGLGGGWRVWMGGGGGMLHQWWC